MAIKGGYSDYLPFNDPERASKVVKDLYAFVETVENQIIDIEKQYPPESLKKQEASATVEQL